MFRSNSPTHSSRSHWYLRGLAVAPIQSEAQGRWTPFYWPNSRGEYEITGIAPARATRCALDYVAFTTREPNRVYSIRLSDMLTQARLPPVTREFPGCRIVAITGTAYRLWALDINTPALLTCIPRRTQNRAEWEWQINRIKGAAPLSQHTRLVAWLHEDRTRLVLWTPGAADACYAEHESGHVSCRPTNLGLSNSEIAALRFGDIVHQDDNVLFFSDLGRECIYRVDLGAKRMYAECVVGANPKEMFGPGRMARIGSISSLAVFRFDINDKMLLNSIFANDDIARKVHEQEFLVCVDAAGKRVVTVDLREKGAYDTLPLIGRLSGQPTEETEDNLLDASITGREIVVNGPHGSLLIGTPGEVQWRWLDPGLRAVKRGRVSSE